MPTTIHDSELVHLTSFYGKIVRENEVIWEVSTEQKYKGYNGTRKIEIELREGATVPGFIWIEGTNGIPFRLTINHRGQRMTCYNCLQANPLCPGGGSW